MIKTTIKNKMDGGFFMPIFKEVSKWIYQIYSRQPEQSTVITLEEAVDMVQETARQQVKVIKDRRPVPEHRE
jgi:hypothetical protein